MSNIRKYSVVIDGHKTSISLEPEFWEGVRAIAAARGMAIGALVGEIDKAAEPGVNLSSALRLAVLAAAGGVKRMAA